MTAENVSLNQEEARELIRVLKAGSFRIKIRQNIQNFQPDDWSNLKAMVGAPAANAMRTHFATGSCCDLLSYPTAPHVLTVGSFD